MIRSQLREGGSWLDLPRGAGHKGVEEKTKNRANTGGRYISRDIRRYVNHATHVSPSTQEPHETKAV